MTNIIDSIRAEYLRYKKLAEAAIEQLSDDELSAQGPNGGNSIAVICWHISGNLRSRFTEFLTSDGEKPWRHREEEFQDRTVTRAALLSKWNQGWEVLLGTLATLSDQQLQLTVTIRGQPLHVHEALHRSLAHLSYHVGQIVYLAKSLRGKDWTYLSIPPGKSDAVNQAPTLERPARARNELTFASYLSAASRMVLSLRNVRFAELWRGSLRTLPSVLTLLALLAFVAALASTYIGNSSSPYGACYAASGRTVPCAAVGHRP